MKVPDLQHNSRKGGISTVRRKHLFLSLSLLIIAGVLFCRPQPTIGSSCTGTCKWYVCVHIVQTGTQDVCTQHFGFGWVSAATITQPCHPTYGGGACHCTAPTPGLNSEMLLYSADCPID